MRAARIVNQGAAIYLILVVVLIVPVPADVTILQVGAIAGDCRRWPAAGRCADGFNKKESKIKHQKTLHQKKDVVNSVRLFGVFAGPSVGLGEHEKTASLPRGP